MLHLRTLTYQPPTRSTGFPFTIPALKALTTLDLSAPVTFFIGENGSGKSTVLESLALAANLPTVGSESVEGDPHAGSTAASREMLQIGLGKKGDAGLLPAC